MSEHKNGDNNHIWWLIWKIQWLFYRLQLWYVKLFSVNRQLVEQTLFIIAAFATMVLVSYLFMSQILSKQMAIQSESIFNSTYHQTSAIFNNLETTVTALASNIEMAIINEQSIEEIHQYLKSIGENHKISFFFEKQNVNRYFFRKGRFYNELDYRGPYCELFGQLIDGVPWEPPDGFNVQNTQWYIDIKNGEGELVYFGPYVSEHSREFSICVGQALYINKDDERQFIGVLSIEVNTEKLVDIVATCHSSPYGYSSLISPERRVVTHYKSEFIGQHVSEVGFEKILGVENFEKHPNSHFIFTQTNSDGIEFIYYSGLLNNNWIVISATPVSEYYRQVWLVGIILVVLGVIMSGTLCFFLTKLYIEKEQADMRSRSKSLFLARMSHEIRTPMNAIVGLSRLVMQEKKQLSPKILKYSAEIHHAANNLLAIINDILDFSKIESGKIEIVKLSFTLSSLVDDVISIIHTRMFDKGLQFISFIDSRLPNNLSGDVVHIRQILLNVLGNAAKYTREGYVAFDIFGTKKDNKMVMISFIIRDTGVGIKQEDQPKLFTDFQQINMESNWSIEGTGLGLSITKELVNRLEGSISMISQHGQGTAFTITLPIEMENDMPCAAIQHVSDHNVLVYEPRPIYEQSLLRTLTHLDIPHEWVRNVSAFYEAVHHNHKLSVIFLASFVYDEVAKLLASPMFSNIQVILLCESPEQYRLSHARSVMLPINALHVAGFLNNSISDFREGSGVETFFKIPMARILVVDDNRPNLLVAEGLLAPYECQIDFVTSGREALRCVQQHHYDLIFMDHMMPEMDGIETTTHIRELAKKNRENHDYYLTMPIIALTANAVFGMKEMFLHNGMDDFLPKPIEPARLNEILMHWIPKEKQQPEEVQTWKSGTSEVIQIPGVNTRVGIIQTGGTLEGYIRVISSLCNELETKVTNMEKALENNDLMMYKMHAHSYKSFLATIGVMPLSVTAAMLEIAAQNDDRATIRVHHSNFVRDLRDIASAVATTLSTMGKRTSSAVISPDDRNLLYSELEQLKSAIAAMKMQQIDSIMEGLFAKRWTKDIVERLEKIMQCITLFEWAEATGLIDMLLED